MVTPAEEDQDTPALSLPTLHGTTRLEPSSQHGKKKQFLAVDGVQFRVHTIWSVAFCPYTPPADEPIFAFALLHQVVVCRLDSENDDCIEILRWFQDEDPKTYLNSLVWGQNPVTGDLLLCACGEYPRKIFVLNVTQGRLEKTLIGHGGMTNGLVISPLASNLLVSSSADNTIRIWDVTCPDEKKHFKVLLAGGGHRYEVNPIAFHRNGRYLLSGGLDTYINLWLVPDLTDPDYPKHEEDLVLDHGVQIIEQPHFSTCEVHGDHMDCLTFYTDLILSKSYREPFILLWRIIGFSSLAPLPSRSSAPLPHPTDPTQKTRSAWSTDNKNAFQVLTRFAMPNCVNSWTHFGLFHSLNVDTHPLLVVGSDNLWISLWDLHALEDEILGAVELEPMPSPGKTVPLLPPTSDERTATRKGRFEGPFKEMLPHKAIRVPNLGKVRDPQAMKHFSFTGDGRWCVAVGEGGLIAVLKWEGVGGKEKEEIGRAMEGMVGQKG